MVDSILLIVEFIGFGMLLVGLRRAIRPGKIKDLGLFSFKELAEPSKK